MQINNLTADYNGFLYLLECSIMGMLVDTRSLFGLVVNLLAHLI